jgi:hypothetical protein
MEAAKSASPGVVRCLRNTAGEVTEMIHRLLTVSALGVVSVFVAAACSVSGSSSDNNVTEVVVLDFYEPCFSDDECPSTTGCFETTVEYTDAFVTDTLCTNPCEFDLDCAFDGKCVNVDGAPLCFARCFDDLDCFEGYACVDFDLDFDPVCLPF